MQENRFCTLIIGRSNGYEAVPVYERTFPAQDWGNAKSRARRHILDDWEEISELTTNEAWVTIKIEGSPGVLKTQFRDRRRVCKWYNPAMWCK